MPVDPIRPDGLLHRVALVTGAGRGLGLAVCRQLLSHGSRVALTARCADAAASAASILGRPANDLAAFQLDVRSPASVAACRDQVLRHFGHVDIVINNAGVFLDDPRRADEGACADAEVLRETLDVNLVGVLRVTEAFLPGMRSRRYGRVVNVSSGMGRWVELEGNSLAYRTAKAALNSLSRVLALREAPFNIKINAVCPGWVRTDMGGPNAVREPEHGAYGVLQAAALPDDGLSGHLLRDGERFGW